MPDTKLPVIVDWEGPGRYGIDQCESRCTLYRLTSSLFTGVISKDFSDLDSVPSEYKVVERATVSFTLSVDNLLDNYDMDVLLDLDDDILYSLVKRLEQMVT